MNKLSLLLLAACSSSTPPSPNPPPPWGVPISGGNMIVARGGGHAWIADADRDRVMSVDLVTGKTAEVALATGDEPGRLAEDSAGRIHVALRRGGAVVTLDDQLHIVARRLVCAEPRGIAADGDNLYVACSGGELVTLPAAGGDPTRVLRLDRDLRDVVIVNGQLYVTRFRTAELLAVDAGGAVTSRVAPPIVTRFTFDSGGELGSGNGSGTPVPANPEVAWRTIALRDGSILMTHQRALGTILHTTPGGYGGQCGGGPVEDALTIVRPGQAPFAALSPLSGALPVDAALSPDGTLVAVVLAGAGIVEEVPVANLGQPDDDPCHGKQGLAQRVIGDDLGAPTSAAYTPDGALVVYYPELPALAVHGAATTIYTLPGDFGYDSGRHLFHEQTGAGLACASCHPEARDDGQTWQFDSEGKRRTQSVAGRILDRGPYHWSGDMVDLPTLMDQVFSERMGGPAVTRSQHLSLGPWLDRIPAPQPPSPVDQAAIDRGRALFQSADAGCGTCHTGPLFTNHALADVGTGGTFKVPSLLGVGARLPLLHDGCATTLADRFGATCGGGDKHGHTSQLTTAQIADLVAYLDSI
ncbi:MAG: cytochrome-c peroxidase [Deltaproteobacteria bacterium]|nr:cytochrome-c peroxidase [Deltaproteobacteria bacterium]